MMKKNQYVDDEEEEPIQLHFKDSSPEEKNPSKKIKFNSSYNDHKLTDHHDQIYRSHRLSNIIKNTSEYNLRRTNGEFQRENGEILPGNSNFYRPLLRKDTENLNKKPEQIQILKEEGQDDYFFRKRKIDEFMQQMVDNPFYLRSLKEEQDRKIVAEFMYERNFRSFEEYLFKCSESGVSLLTHPYECKLIFYKQFYKVFGQKRQFPLKNKQDLKMLQSKHNLLSLYEDLEAAAKRQAQKKLEQKEKEKQKMQQEIQMRQKEQKDQLLQELQKKYKNIERAQKRQAGIQKYQQELRKTINNGKIIVKREYEDIQEKKQTQQQEYQPIYVDNSILQKEVDLKGLKEYKNKVFELFKQACQETRQIVQNELDRKRIENKEAMVRQREARMAARALRESNKKFQQEENDNNDELSDQSSDSILKVVLKERSIEKSQEKQQNLVKDQVPQEKTIQQEDQNQQQMENLSRSFESSEDSICYNKDRFFRNIDSD